MFLFPRFAQHARFRLAVLLLLLLPLVAACDDPGMGELVAEMALEWALENELVSVDEAGALGINYGQIVIYEGTRWINGTTGDSQLDAALDVGPIAKSIRDADNLAAAGMATRDVSRLDQAITLRPQDWSYRDQKAAVLAAQGDEAGAKAAIQESEELVAQRITADGDCRALKQNMLRNRQDALSRQLADDSENEVLMELLMDTQDALFQLQNRLPGSPCP